MPAPSTLLAVVPPARPANLPLATRIADYCVMALAVILGGGSIVLFALAGGPFVVPMRLSPGAVLWWNALLSMVFFVQHSVMVRRAVRARLAAVVPARYDAAFYAITSGIALALVAVLYQTPGTPLFVLHGVPRLLFAAAALAGITNLAWGVYALRTFDPCGLRPIRKHLHRGRDASAPEWQARAGQFVVRGPYRWVRHPLYSAIILLLWADPEMKAARLELALLWTTWICVGALLEERDLIADFGDAYRRYRRQVPMLIPWRGPVRVQLGNDGSAAPAAPLASS